MTFLVGHWPADPKGTGQMAYKFSIKWLFYMKQNTLNDSLEVHHLYYLQNKVVKQKIITLAQLGQAEKKKNIKTEHITPAHLGWVEKCKLKTLLQLVWAGQKNIKCYWQEFKK